jgi:diacylglycerol O-acyltransferase
MTERMSAADVAFLHRETGTAPQHVGELALFDVPAAGFDYDRLVRLLEERIPLAPRYRHKVRMVPGNLAYPVWVDDQAFDITYHVRRSALPRPGTEEQLLEFCARVQSRPLDRSRPLWEIYLVEGLGDGRIAIVTKTHEAVVGEVGGIDIAQVILDAAPEPRRTVSPVWVPEAEPSAFALVHDAVLDVLHRPQSVVEPVRAATRDLRRSAERVAAVAGSVAFGAAVAVRRPPRSPLHVQLGEHRRLAVARTGLADYRAVRAELGGSVNDVVLAVVAGALRGWLLARAEPLRPATTVRALVPVSVTDAADAHADPGAVGPAGVDRAGVDRAAADQLRSRAAHPSAGGRPSPATPGPVRPLLVDLPVGEPDPVLRVAQVRYAMATHKASGQAVSADRIAGLSGFAPPTLHALGARAAGTLARRLFSLVVTNVPGPQLPLYAAGARLSEMFPIQPLAPGQALSVALTSYDGRVLYGINGDRDGMRDVRLFAELIEECLAELVTATGAASAVRR